MQFYRNLYHFSTKNTAYQKSAKKLKTWTTESPLDEWATARWNDPNQTKDLDTVLNIIFFSIAVIEQIELVDFSNFFAVDATFVSMSISVLNYDILQYNGFFKVHFENRTKNSYRYFEFK